MDVVKWILAVVGHVGLCCAAFNHIHASAFPRGQRKTSEKIIALLAVVPLLIFLWSTVRYGSFNIDSYLLLIRYYLMVAALFGVFLICRWAFRKTTVLRPGGVRLLSDRYLKIQSLHKKPLLSGRKAKLFGSLPLNQILHLKVEHWELEIPNLPEALDGLRIVQLSDFHFTGMIQREFFETIIEQANEFEPDLVFITGDVVDEVECLDWIQPIFSSINSKSGAFYVLGNHDLLIRDEPRLRELIARTGVTWAGDGKWHDLEINGGHLRLSGNALPWFTHCNKLAIDDLGPNDGEAEQPFKILLSHSPDQMIWAKDYGFDLMFGGHTHGGQVRLPIIGPIIAPSRYGVKFASGNFQIGQMLMHISRGLSGDEPVRFFCPPELGCFTLRRKTG